MKILLSFLTGLFYEEETEDKGTEWKRFCETNEYYEGVEQENGF